MSVLYKGIFVMEFLSDKLLLQSDKAVELYTEYARDLPIIDYHCHINPAEILADKRFNDITELWLAGDHYKWRLMRNCGIDERLITGDGDSYDKFYAFCSVLPLCIGNPIHIWCHMELKTYFGYDGEINADTARTIYDLTKAKLAQEGFSARGIALRSKVELICTTDDPADDLAAHIALAKDPTLKIKVLPTFRPDMAVNINLPTFVPYIARLSKAWGKPIKTFDDMLNALTGRLDYFVSVGCLITDHALTEYLYEECDLATASVIWSKAAQGKAITKEESDQYKSFVMLYLARLYAQRGLIMQLHFNCLRNNNGAMYSRLGPDTGFDCINLSSNPDKLAKFFNNLSKDDALPKTVVYSLDPGDNRLINTIINCFQGGSAGKLQSGSAWWFNDTKQGMRDHLSSLAEYSVLGNFVGMLTDSRSFTSYVRHDYFRRLLCNFIADAVNNGEYPDNPALLKTLVTNISYYNVKNYLGI